MPKLWEQTVEAHRREVRSAILDAVAELVGGRGLGAVTMSKVAARAGIGRATLYKYFPDVEAVLRAWHERQVAAHLEALRARGAHGADPRARLESVLAAYASIVHEARASHDRRLVTLLHRDDRVAAAQQELHDFVRGLLAEAADVDAVRSDVPADELATYCLAAVSAAAGLPSTAAVQRLVGVTLAALRPPL